LKLKYRITAQMVRIAFSHRTESYRILGAATQSGVGMNSRALIFSINSGPLTLDRNKV